MDGRPLGVRVNLQAFAHEAAAQHLQLYLIELVGGQAPIHPPFGELVFRKRLQDMAVFLQATVVAALRVGKVVGGGFVVLGDLLLGLGHPWREFALTEGERGRASEPLGSSGGFSIGITPAGCQGQSRKHC